MFLAILNTVIIYLLNGLICCLCCFTLNHIRKSQIVFKTQMKLIRRKLGLADLLRLLPSGCKVASSGCFYSVDYIHKCVEQNKSLDIERFRISEHLTEQSPFVDDEFGVSEGDVSDSRILNGSSQEQLPEHSQRPSVTRRSSVDSSNDSPVAKFKDNLSKLIQKSPPIAKNRCTGDSINVFVVSDKVHMRRKKYNEKEDIAIMKYIVEHKRYSEVKGIKLWRDMEELQACYSIFY